MDYGQIVLVDSNVQESWIAPFIQWFTNSPFSHSLVKIPAILNNPMCMEATGGGVDTKKFSGYQYDPNCGYEVWQLNLPQETIDSAISSLLNELEIGYDYLAYVWFIWRKICSIFGKDIKNQNNWFSNNGLVCSALCVAFLRNCKLDSYLQGYGNGSIVPGDLHNIFSAHPEMFTLVEKVRM